MPHLTREDSLQERMEIDALLEIPKPRAIEIEREINRREISLEIGCNHEEAFASKRLIAGVEITYFICGICGCEASITTSCDHASSPAKDEP